MTKFKTKNLKKPQKNTFSLTSWKRCIIEKNKWYRHTWGSVSFHLTPYLSSNYTVCQNSKQKTAKTTLLLTSWKRSTLEENKWYRHTWSSVSFRLTPYLSSNYTVCQNWKQKTFKNLKKPLYCLLVENAVQ